MPILNSQRGRGGDAHYRSDSAGQQPNGADALDGRRDDVSTARGSFGTLDASTIAGDLVCETGIAGATCMVQATNFAVRRAELVDVEDIAAAHLDSIRSIGALYYPAEIVNDWAARVKGDLYAHAMTRGEVFFIAIGELNGTLQVLGFSSHGIDGDEHHAGVYVRGQAARLGIGSALLRSAEAAAIAAGATSIRLDASLAAVEFYKANGFEEVSRGEHRLWSGQLMACVFMRKNLDARRDSFGV